MSRNIDIVMPLIARDRQRFFTWLKSYQALWEVPGRLLVYVRESELARFSDLPTLDSRIVVQPKSSVGGCVVQVSDVQCNSIQLCPGWFRQQLVKLGAATHVDGLFFSCCRLRHVCD